MDAIIEQLPGLADHDGPVRFEQLQNDVDYLQSLLNVATKSFCHLTQVAKHREGPGLHLFRTTEDSILSDIINQEMTRNIDPVDMPRDFFTLFSSDKPAAGCELLFVEQQPFNRQSLGKMLLKAIVHTSKIVFRVMQTATVFAKCLAETLQEVKDSNFSQFPTIFLQKWLAIHLSDFHP